MKKTQNKIISFAKVLINAYFPVFLFSLICKFYEGGYGTMEELLEMITWSQLGIHDKPVSLIVSLTPKFCYILTMHAQVVKLKY